MPDFEKKLDGVRVLLVEDNKTCSMVCTALLKKMGCHVDSVEDGFEALKKFENDYDVILMDCYMPNLDGYETTKAIRDAEKESGRNVTIIALTAATKGDIDEEFIKVGMSDYLFKPIEYNALLEKILLYTKRT